MDAMAYGTLPMVPTSFPAKARAEILRRTQDLGVPTVTCPWLRVVGRKVFGGCFFELKIKKDGNYR